MVGTSNFLICLNISSREFERSRVLAHPCPPPPFPLPPHPPTSNWKGHSWFSKSKHNFLPFLEYKSVCTWRSMYWKDCNSNAKAKQLKKYLLFPWNTNQCVRDGPWTGRIVYRMQKRNNWKNICYSLVARRTSVNISTELVVHTNNWESRHNFLALEKVNSRGLRISFALFPELINNEHTEYFTGIQREYFKWIYRRLRPSADAWRASYDS